MSDSVSSDRLDLAYRSARDALLAERNSAGHWEGRLSSSALSTATAVMALHLMHRATKPTGGNPWVLIDRALTWLAAHQNADGGWGDTTQSKSNISTTMLVHAVFHTTGKTDEFRRIVEAAEDYIQLAGGVQAVLNRYGKDRTFSVPILTHCALAGLVDWQYVIPLPFELSCVPARLYKAIRLPVVSYALPALIAVGQVRFHHLKPANPVVRVLRRWAIARSLRILERIQPENGGFLEATPLTSFVTMSLAGMGLSDHRVAQRGLQFLIESVQPDGSWTIDTNLATWVTTLSVNALREDVPPEDRRTIREWLLNQQYRTVHPYTNADPGGWAWTDLPGGVPDADDTPGAILALLNLRVGKEADRQLSHERTSSAETKALRAAVQWLLDLQNRDGGWPTFCRGWGTLPFDRSAPDITAHVLRALFAWSQLPESMRQEPRLASSTKRALQTGFEYLSQAQQLDGSWLPLWFGNQHAEEDENPAYGTARVLAAYRDTGRLATDEAQLGVLWLLQAQNDDGAWGGAAGVPSNVEETALAVEVLISAAPQQQATLQGLSWLLDRVENGSYGDTSPIGFYFAKLWYFEKLYPRIFTTAALHRAVSVFGQCSEFRDVPDRDDQPLQQTVSP